MAEGGGLAPEYLDDEDAYFNYVVINVSVILNISFLKAAKDSLIVSGKAGIQPNQENEVQGPTKLMKESLYDLEIVILQMNLDFTIDSTNSEGEEFSISDIQVQRKEFFDGLSKDRLFETMALIFNCLNVARMKFVLLR